MQKFLAWLQGRRPEYIDPRVLAHGEGREGPGVCPAESAEAQGCSWRGRRCLVFRATNIVRNIEHI